MNGWDAETQAAQLLSNLGVKEEYHLMQMKGLQLFQVQEEA